MVLRRCTRLWPTLLSMVWYGTMIKPFIGIVVRKAAVITIITGMKNLLPKNYTLFHVIQIMLLEMQAMGKMRLQEYITNGVIFQITVSPFLRMHMAFIKKSVTCDKLTAGWVSFKNEYDSIKMEFKKGPFAQDAVFEKVNEQSDQIREATREVRKEHRDAIREKKWDKALGNLRGELDHSRNTYQLYELISLRIGCKKQIVDDVKQKILFI